MGETGALEVWNQRVSEIGHWFCKVRKEGSRVKVLL